MGIKRDTGYFCDAIPESFTSFFNLRSAPSTRISFLILWLTRENPEFTTRRLKEKLEGIKNCIQPQVIEKTLQELRKTEAIVTPSSDNETFKVTPYGRFHITKNLLDQGLGLEVVSQLLNWQEFEQFCRSIIELHNFTCEQNYRFSHEGRRYEIDIVSIRKPMILIVDAKRWASKINNSSALREAVKSQNQRTKSFRKSLSDNLVLARFDLSDWKTAEILPVVISIYDQKILIEKKGVVVPIFRLNDFLLNLSNIWNDLPFIDTTIRARNLTLNEP